MKNKIYRYIDTGCFFFIKLDWQLETLVNDFLNLSIRKAASAVGVSSKLILIILHDDMHLKPYKLSL
jgi:hypothetical protein